MCTYIHIYIHFIYIYIYMMCMNWGTHVFLQRVISMVYV